jgi:cyclic pyranopterin phosphate synthase
MTRLTHLDESGAAHMVDIGEKGDTPREAVAEGFIALGKEARAAIATGSTAKGDVLAVARVAGIMAAKKTSELIPLCHPLALTRVSIEFEARSEGLRVEARVALTGRTGVEMEALTAVSVALLTVYDMLKAVDKGMVIGRIALLSKTGGKSGDWTRRP